MSEQIWVNCPTRTISGYDGGTLLIQYYQDVPLVPLVPFKIILAALIMGKMKYNLDMKILSDTNPDLQDKENPNNLTLEAIEELESGGGKKYSSFKSMVDDLEDEQNS